MSRLRFILVVFACGLFWTTLGLLLGGLFRHPLGGFVIGALFGIIYCLSGSWAADKFPGDVWDAKLLENINAPHLYDMLRSLCDRTGQALPTLYFVPRAEPNAFVTAGRDGESAVIVTSGLTQALEKDEVQAVMALMMARLATGAMPGWAVAATLAGMPLQVGLFCRRRSGLVWLGNAILTAFSYPSAALTWLVLDSGTVTASDYHAAHLTEQAGSLQRALAKIEADANWEDTEQGSPATAFLFAVPPLPPMTTDAPAWQRGLQAFPFRHPDAAKRAEHFADVVPSYVPEPPEEFSVLRQDPRDSY